jgi:Tol biopolymer transport system component/glutamine cyclotransferase
MPEFVGNQRRSGLVGKTALPRRHAIAMLVAIALLIVTLSPVAATYRGSSNGRLAFAIKDADGNPQITTVAADGSGAKALTTGAFFHACAAYSADGGKIAYCSNQSGAFEIWTMNADGTDQAQLTKLGGSATFPDFSPDGTLVAFDGTSGTDTHTEILTVDAATGMSVTVLTSCATGKAGCGNNYPAWSPDGSQIVFIHTDDTDAEGNPTAEQVWLMDADGSNAHVLTTDASLKDQLPDWSPDGSKIAYQSGPAGSGGIWVMNADGSDQHQLTGCTATDPSPCATGDDFGAAWSPGGLQIAFVSLLGDTDRPVMVINADGTDVHRLMPGPSIQFVPGWQPIVETATPSASGSAGPDASTGPSPSLSTLPHGVLASIPFAAGNAPAVALIGYGSVWVNSHRGNLLYRIDPETNLVIATIDVGQLSCGSAMGAGRVWLMPCFDNPNAVAVDAATNRVIGSFDAWPAVFTPDTIWATNYDGHLHEVDPTTLATVKTYDPFEDSPVSWVVSAGGYIWAVGENYDGGWGGSIAKIDPVAHRIVDTLSVPGVGNYADVSADLGYIWVKDGESDALTRIDPTTEAITTFHIPGFSGRLSQYWDIYPATGLGSVWLRMSDGVVSRVDSATGQVTGTYPADPAGGGGMPVVGFGSLWVPNFGTDTIWRDQVMS